MKTSSPVTPLVNLLHAARRQIGLAIVQLQWKLRALTEESRTRQISADQIRNSIANARSGAARSGAPGPVDADAAREGRTEDWIRRALTRFPYWVSGHRLLAEIALAHDDIATVYASAQAILQLEPTSREAQLLLGKVLLRKGSAREAIQVLDQARHQNVNSIDAITVECLREIGAAHMLLGDNARAREVLEALPAEARDPASVAALQYVRAKELNPQE